MIRETGAIKAVQLFAHVGDSVTAVWVCADPFKTSYSYAVAY
jgi:hypothetical protein